MLIEKINENEIKVLLSLDDLNSNNISIHSFMCNSKEWQKLFANILNCVTKKMCFPKKNYNFIVETFSIPSKSFFIMLITYVPQKTSLQLYTTPVKNYKFKHGFWLEFNCLDDFCMFCNFLNFKFNASLYFFNKHYFLHIKQKNLKQYFKILNISSEFSKVIHSNGILFNRNAKCIIKENAIQTAQKYFI